MLQGIIIWLVTLLLGYLIVGWLSQTIKVINRKYLIVLFFYHSLLALSYYVYALSNPSDSRAYYRRIITDYRGDDWMSSYGISTTFIEFIGYPFVKVFGFTYEATMVVYAFFGFIGFVFFYIFFKEHIKTQPRFLYVNFFTLIFFLPNLHFWSSSLGKGSLIFMGFGMFFFALSKPLPRLWALILGGWIIFMVRPHIFYVILIAIALGYTFSRKGVNIFYRVLILSLSIFLLYYINEDILKLTGMEDEFILDVDFSVRADRLTRATSGIDIANYSFPEKMFAFWFRPLFIDAPGILGLIVSFENLLYLLIFALLLQPRAISYLWRSNPFVKTSLLTFLGVSVALAQISGNLGLAMRQKSQVMILMMFVILKFLDEQKVVELKRIILRRKQRKQQVIES